MTIDEVLLGSTIRELRERKGLTQQQLADQLKVTVAYLSRLENGHRGISIPNLNALAEILAVPSSVIALLATRMDSNLEDDMYKALLQLRKLAKVTIGTE
jgi:transcriptional regulator with XRE-family HTH domain